MFREDQRKYPKKHTAAWRLFHYDYRVYYPALFNYSTEWLEKRGMVITGDGALDRSRLTLPELNRQSPAGMAMLLEEGAPITADAFFDIEDIPYVYYDIQEHLGDWEKQLNRGVHINDLPDVYDFRKLEALAVELHTMAIALTEDQPRGSGLRGRLNRLNSARATYRPSKEDLDEVQRTVPYVSIADRIERQSIRGNVWQ